METKMGILELIQVKQLNAVEGSKPICIKKWVKVKYIPNQEQLAGLNQ